jgi:hypothetical protein
MDCAQQNILGTQCTTLLSYGSADVALCGWEWPWTAGTNEIECGAVAKAAEYISPLIESDAV